MSKKNCWTTVQQLAIQRRYVQLLRLTKISLSYYGSGIIAGLLVFRRLILTQLVYDKRHYSGRYSDGIKLSMVASIRAPEHKSAYYGPNARTRFMTAFFKDRKGRSMRTIAVELFLVKKNLIVLSCLMTSRSQPMT